MSTRQLDSARPTHLATFGELLGEAAALLHLSDPNVGGLRYAPELARKGSVSNYFRGVATPKESDGVISSFAGAFLCSQLIPGLRECIEWATPETATTPPTGAGGMTATDVAVVLVKNRLHALEQRWNNVVHTLHGQPAAAGIAAAVLAEPYLRMFVPDLALQLAALVGLGVLPRPLEARIIACCRLDGPTVLQQILDECDGDKRADYSRVEVIKLFRQTAKRTSKGPPATSPKRTDRDTTIDRLLTEPDHVPEDETLRRLSEVLAPAFAGRTEAQLHLSLRRRYALLAVVKRANELLGADVHTVLAKPLAEFFRLFVDGPVGPSRDPYWRRRLAELALAGAAHPTGRRLMKWLAEETKGTYRYDLLAIADAREEIRLAQCTWNLAAFEPAVRRAMSTYGCDRAAAETAARHALRELQGENESPRGLGSGYVASETDIPAALATQHLKWALQAEQGLDFQEAARHYTAALTNDPRNPDLLCARARCRFVTDGYGAAVGDLRAALAAAPANSKLNLLLAEMMLHEGQTAGALDHLRRFAANHGSAWPQLPFLTGMAYWKLEQWENALAQFRRVLDLQDDHAEACTYAARCCRKLGLPRDAQRLESRATNLGADTRAADGTQ